jgi:NitT/TauT family transport system ATP-binding protein
MHDLALSGVTLEYESAQQTVTALSNVDLIVRPGEFVSVLGPSGCGKSTLLKLASGLLAPTKGRVLLKGHDVVGPRKDVGMVFQQPTLLPWKSVIDNVMLPARIMKSDPDQARQAATDLLKLVGLSDFARSYPRELSGGMQQRVAIARGLLANPSLLLMDEPFSALDAMTRDSMMMELQKIWMGAQKSVLFITHSIPEAVFLSDRILVMSPRPGRVVEDLRIALPRPRTADTLSSDEFMETTRHLRRLFEGLTAKEEATRGS